MYYDPFANLDPDLIKPFKPAEKPEPPAINPEASEFHPSAQGVSENLENVPEQQQQQQQCPEGVWQIVASEAGGRAVAVMLTSEGGVLACSSPAFLSSCSHPGLPCMAWDTVEGLGSLASDSPQPEWGQNFTDSGFENGYDAFTDNSSEQSGEGLLLAEAPPYVSELSFTREQYLAPAPLHVYPAPGPGEGYTCRGGELPQGFTKSLPEAIALAPDTVVVEHYPSSTGEHYPSTTGEHYPAPLVVQEQQYESWGSHDHSSPISWSAGLGLNIPSLEGEASPSYSPSTYASSTYTEQTPTFTNLGYPGLEADPLSPTGQTQFIHLGGLPALHSDMAALSLGERRREKTEEERLLAREEKRKREEFKKKVLYNLSGSSEEREEMKIRDDFKDQVLSNLRKEQQQRESEEQKIKRAFKDKIISNLSAPSIKS